MMPISISLTFMYYINPFICIGPIIYHNSKWALNPFLSQAKMYYCTDTKLQCLSSSYRLTVLFQAIISDSNPECSKTDIEFWHVFKKYKVIWNIIVILLYWGFQYNMWLRLSCKLKRADIIKVYRKRFEVNRCVFKVIAKYNLNRPIYLFVRIRAKHIVRNLHFLTKLILFHTRNNNMIFHSSFAMLCFLIKKIHV